MKQIPLSGENGQGLFVLVDDEDYECVVRYKWYAKRYKHTTYASARIDGKLITMHRFLLDIKDSNVICDHINMNGLDNQKSNLRLVDKSKNGMNSGPKSSRTSEYKGVNWQPQAKKWTARINLKDRAIYLGIFDDEKYAALAYDNAARKYFGEYAYLNFPESICTDEEIDSKRSKQYRPNNAQSKFWGVTYDKRREKWIAQIWIKGMCGQRYIGAFDNEIDAAKAYDTVAKGIGKKRLNFAYGDVI